MAQFKTAAAGETEAMFRQFLAYMFAPPGGYATVGVLNGLAVKQTTTASGSVTVDAGLGLSQPSTLAGCSPLLNNGLFTIDVLGANPMGGLPRWDEIVFDPATSTLKVIIGTPNASPGRPTIPTAAVPLASLQHAASATTIPTAKIIDLRKKAHMFGGTAIVDNSIERNRLDKYVGLRIYRTDGNREEQWDGTGWMTFLSGETTVTLNANSDFSLNTGMQQVFTATMENNNGGSADGARTNLTISKNGPYAGGLLTGRVYRAEDKGALPAGFTLGVMWKAWGYSA